MLLCLTCLCVQLQLNKSIAAKLAAINSTRLLGSTIGDMQQAARRLRELLSSVLATAAAAAAGAGSGTAGDAAAAAAGLANGSSAATAATAAEGAKGVSTAAGGAVKIETKLLRLLLDPLEAQVGLQGPPLAK